MPRPPSNRSTDSQDSEYLSERPPYKESYRPPWWPLLIAVPVIIPLFWTYRVEVKGDELTVGYNTSLCSKTFKVNDIDQMRACEVKGLSWGGWGIKYSLSGDGWGYICKDGAGISLLDTSNNRKYTFNCEHPQQLMAQLRALRSDNSLMHA